MAKIAICKWYFLQFGFFYKIYLKGEDNSDKNNVHRYDWKKMFSFANGYNFLNQFLP